VPVPELTSSRKASQDELLEWGRERFWHFAAAGGLHLLAERGRGSSRMKSPRLLTAGAFGLTKGEVSARGATYREGAVLLWGGE
jgi:hypothetical protein